ncbi:F-box/LRR-repeat protein At5g02910 [Quercus suber]|uniref:F-box/LRR-repeat protein At5g02910 n=1 Tax=Quercus suber TaxID=58331 RepID=UPI0032E01BB3
MTLMNTMIVTDTMFGPIILTEKKNNNNKNQAMIIEPNAANTHLTGLDSHQHPLPLDHKTSHQQNQRFVQKMGPSLDLASFSPFRFIPVRKRCRFRHCRERYPAPAQGSQTHKFLHYIGPIRAYILPQHLYANEFVSELDFCSCKIKPSGLVNWSSLKRLCIGFTALCEDGIRKVLMGSPRLEFLKLNNCFRFNRLDIVSESLRKLVIDGYLDRDYIDNSDGGSDEAELEIVGDFFRKKCWIKNVSALVEVKLQFFSSSDFKDFGEEDACKRHEDNVKKLIESLHHVKNLNVGKWCLTALSIMSVKHLPSPLSMCKCLMIQTSMGKCDLLGIGSLLQSSPYVETLVIDINPATTCGQRL